MLTKYINKIKGKLGIPVIYPSETSKVRHLVLPYCVGTGCDIGFGGDKIKKVDCLGIDFAQPYAHTGKDKVDIACNVMEEPIPVEDNFFDYVYTSHLIEDFRDTNAALIEFIRILKSGGNLILVFPDQPTYEAHCKRTGQPLNTFHVHATMGYDYMIDRLNELTGIQYKIEYSSNKEIDYNVIMVIKVYKNGIN